uniref:Thyrostimulin alpha-2 subunit-like isoform X2 n=1 Tax=Dermatophagoides pteronyssinus TaxID=6956 RepID=A0A6P6Y2U3_DERPT|nr:thyrostimulin alpha-2 subunit-like isoform X2 [Dermatophagoides pteronyssinus]
MVMITVLIWPSSLSSASIASHRALKKQYQNRLVRASKNPSNNSIMNNRSATWLQYSSLWPTIRHYPHHYHQHGHQYCFWFGLMMILLVVLMADSGSSSVWEQKGCHIVGHTQRIDIPGCINFELTSNACRGYCLSYAIPSNQETLLVNDQQMITSVGNCCAMTETEVMSVRVMCRNGPKDIKFKSASKCGCFHCKKY